MAYTKLNAMNKTLFGTKSVTLRAAYLLRIHSNKFSTNFLESKYNEKFNETLPEVISTLINNTQLKELPNYTDRLNKVFDYNLNGENHLQGLTTIYAYESFESPENVNEENLKLACVLGWCTEMIKICHFITKDIEEDSHIRNGKKCWHRVTGNLVANDTTLILTAVTELIKIYFENTPHYRSIVHAFSKTVLNNCIGQNLYTELSRSKKYTTYDYYNFIVKYKTLPLMVKLPFTLGLILSNIKDNALYEETDRICFEMAKLLQTQIDFNDCFGHQSTIKSNGNESTEKSQCKIGKGKLTWLATKAKERCTPAQSALFEKCYGSEDTTNIETIKRLYGQLNLQETFTKFRDEQYDTILEMSRKLSPFLSPEPFINFASNVREKQNCF